MGRKNRQSDEWVPLCERCGYPLKGLPAHGPETNCPECGLAIAASLPARRTGSPWQIEPGPGALVRTAWLMLRHPVSGWDRVRAEEKRSRELEVLMAMAAGVVGAFPLAIGPLVAKVHYIRSDNARLADLVLLFMLILLVCAPVLMLVVRVLITLEKRGVRFIGKRRGWRITPAIAQTVCAHAAVGWILCAVFTWAGIWLTNSPSLRSAIERMINATGINLFTVDMVLSFVGFVAGMMVFETLVYIGIRRMRFANREVEPATPTEA